MKRAWVLGIVFLSLYAIKRIYFASPSTVVPRTVPGSGEAIDGGATAPSGEYRNGATDPTAGPQKARSLEDFLGKRSLPGWKVFRDENGQIKNIIGTKIFVAENTPADVSEVARELAPYFGVNAREIALAEEESEIRSKSASTYHFEQRVEGFEVYGGSLEMTLNHADNGIYIVNNGLKNVGSFNASLGVSAATARSALLTHFVNRVPKVDKVLPQPQIYPVGNGRSQLAWVFYVDVLAPKRDRLMVLWSAETNLPLSEHSVISH